MEPVHSWVELTARHTRRGEEHVLASSLVSHLGTRPATLGQALVTEVDDSDHTLHHSNLAIHIVDHEHNCCCCADL